MLRIKEGEEEGRTEASSDIKIWIADRRHQSHAYGKISHA